MKLIVAIVLTFNFHFCFADGWGSLSGKNKDGDLIHIYPSDQIDYHTADNSGLFDVILYEGGNMEIVNPIGFKGQRCKFKNSKNDISVPIEFSCEKSVKSPISGATFKITRNRNNKDCSYEFMYVCTSGCSSPATPQQMTQSYWECVQ